MSDVSLTEAIYGQDCKVDREAGLIRNVKILGLQSPSKNRRYSGAAAKKALPLYEGARIFLNHPKKTEQGNPRSFNDRVGTIVNAQFREGEGNFGDFKYIPAHPLTESILWLAENDPKSFGMSHNAKGRGRIENGQQVIEEIVRVLSVDLVSDPATTNGLFESEEGDDEMDFSKLTIDEIKTNRPDLVESLTESILSESKGAEELNTLKGELKTLREEVDRYKTAEAIAAKREKAVSLCESAKLPKEAQTDIFLDQLLEAKDDAAMSALIEDRKALVGIGKGQPKSKEQGGGSSSVTDGKSFVRALRAS